MDGALSTPQASPGTSAAADGAALVLTLELGAHGDAFLSLAASAVAAYSGFVFDTAEEAHALRAYLLRRGGADFAPPAGRLLLVDGVPAGVLAVLSPDLVRQRRLAAALALVREPRYADDAVLRQRLDLAASTLHAVRQNEAYLACIAVGERFAGRGLGRWLLCEALAEARRLGLPRLVLEVAEDNRRAIDLYTRAGFREVGRASVADPSTGRTLAFRHLAADVPGPSSPDHPLESS
jgi:ribosomal protein S18 acetylase RimI-like enzyme